MDICVVALFISLVSTYGLDIRNFEKIKFNIRWKPRILMILTCTIVTASTGSCHNDKFWCHQLWERWYYDNSWYSVLIILCMTKLHSFFNIFLYASIDSRAGQQALASIGLTTTPAPHRYSDILVTHYSTRYQQISCTGTGYHSGFDDQVITDGTTLDWSKRNREGGLFHYSFILLC